METILFRRSHIDKFILIAGKFPEDADILFRDIAGSDNTEFKEVGNPFGILIVILLTFDSLDPFRIGNNDIRNMAF